MRTQRWLAAIALGFAATVAPLAVSSPAQAAPTVCDPNYMWNTWSGATQPWAVTHASRYENYSGATVTWTRAASFRAKLTAGSTITTGVSAGASVEILQLGATLGSSLAVNGSATSTVSQSVTGTLANNHIAIFFQGNRSARGSWKRYKCNAAGTASSQVGSGTTRSFGVNTQGVVDCASSPSPSSLAYVVRAQYC
ncbi:3D (Asp-Asp-Asp) domain-containing protein [Allocatelliglobosispora scoriae]|uniref:3D (Asp-Asp-Asp) domain-containing protein n=1 Tax=Allocatelliglobosispora scoriae TaxID=643052 RepID=A0A841BGS7_9ACTN|nr:hypothetical protein [Allocatelliglobosispora scoriae]MBB5868287.1 3D (Asp-Asp-Asp) domain-containing protein [Allocatelliglobosispora scoriae]